MTEKLYGLDDIPEGWRPIETAPKYRIGGPEVRVLLTSRFITDEGKERVDWTQVGCRWDDGWYITTDGFGRGGCAHFGELKVGYPTHWMPIPSLPIPPQSHTESTGWVPLWLDKNETAWAVNSRVFGSREEVESYVAGMTVHPENIRIARVEWEAD